MQYIKQNGQSIVEFSMILPIFFLIVFGFIYLAMFLIDYSTLNNFAANMARRTALGESITIEEQDIDNLLMLDSYYDFTPRLTESDKISTVTIDATRKDLSSFILDSALPEQYSVSSSMEKIQLEPEVITNTVTITIGNEQEALDSKTLEYILTSFATVANSQHGYGTIIVNGSKYAILKEDPDRPPGNILIGALADYYWDKSMQTLFNIEPIDPMEE